MKFKITYCSYSNVKEFALIKKFIDWQQDTYHLDQVDIGVMLNLNQGKSCIIVSDYYTDEELGRGFDNFYQRFKEKGLHKL